MLIGLAACVAVRTARAAEPGLSVETGSPDALCPDLGATRAAVRDRIGQLSLEGPKSWVARYTIGHAPSAGGDYVLLVLKDDTGAVRLERRLPMSGESCTTVVQAIALVLDRYFRELQAPSSPPARAPQPAVPEDEPELERAQAEPSGAPSLQVALQGGLALGPRTGAIGLELGAWFAGWLHASFQPQLLVPSVAETIRGDSGDMRGSAEVLELPFRFALGLGKTSERWSWHVGPALRVSMRRASTSDLVIVVDGEYKSGDSAATGWAVAGGVGTGATYWLLPGFGLTTSLVFDVQISETRFRVLDSAAERTLLASSSPQGQALVGIAFGARP